MILSDKEREILIIAINRKENIRLKMVNGKIAIFTGDYCIHDNTDWVTSLSTKYGYFKKIENGNK